MEEMNEPYFVEVDNNGCSKCGAGRTYTVIGPDGIGASTSWCLDEDAEAYAAECNAAFDAGIKWARGRNSPKKKRSSRGKCVSKTLINALKTLEGKK